MAFHIDRRDGYALYSISKGGGNSQRQFNRLIIKIYIVLIHKQQWSEHERCDLKIGCKANGWTDEKIPAQINSDTLRSVKISTGFFFFFLSQYTHLIFKG